MICEDMIFQSPASSPSRQEKKARRQGGRTKGPAAFEDDDRERFRANLQRLVEDALRDGE